MTEQQRLNRILTAGKNGKFFTVKFIKRTTGKPRTMNCRLGVKKHLQGGTLAYDPAEHALLTVFDVKANGYRSIPLESVFEINGEPIE